jgi:hypothetical protein
MEQHPPQTIGSSGGKFVDYLGTAQYDPASDPGKIFGFRELAQIDPF